MGSCSKFWFWLVIYAPWLSMSLAHPQPSVDTRRPRFPIPTKKTTTRPKPPPPHPPQNKQRLIFSAFMPVVARTGVSRARAQWVGVD